RRVNHFALVKGFCNYSVRGGHKNAVAAVLTAPHDEIPDRKTLPVRAFTEYYPPSGVGCRTKLLCQTASLHLKSSLNLLINYRNIFLYPDFVFAEQRYRARQQLPFRLHHPKLQGFGGVVLI